MTLCNLDLKLLQQNKRFNIILTARIEKTSPASQEKCVKVQVKCHNFCIFTHRWPSYSTQHLSYQQDVIHISLWQHLESIYIPTFMTVIRMTELKSWRPGRDRLVFLRLVNPNNLFSRWVIIRLKKKKKIQLNVLFQA